MQPDKPFQSPKGEIAWAIQRDSNFWVYPNWEINLTAYRKELERAGYQRFVQLSETVPRSVKMKEPNLELENRSSLTGINRHATLLGA